MLIVIDYYAENPIVGKTLQSCYLDNSNVYDDINGNGDSDWTISNSSSLTLTSSSINLNGSTVNINWDYATVVGPIYSASPVRISGSDIYLGNPLNTEGTNVNFYDVNQIKIPGGTNGQVLTTDGSSNLSWTTVSGGGGSSSVQVITDIDTQTVDTTSNTTVVFLDKSYNIINDDFIPSTGLTDGFTKKIIFNSRYEQNPYQIATQSSSFQNINDSLEVNGYLYVAPRLMNSGGFAPFDINNPNIVQSTISATNRLLRINTDAPGIINEFVSIGDFNNQIFKIKKDSINRIWVCGAFSTINGISFPGIAVWNGSIWINPCANSATQPTGSIFDFIIKDDSIFEFYAIGTMTNTIGTITLNQTMYSTNQGTTITRGWGTTGFGTTPTEICCLAYDSLNNIMYCGNNSTTFNGQSLPYLYQVNLTTNTISQVGTVILNAQVMALTFYNGELIIFGNFQFTSPFYCARICKYNGIDLQFFSYGFPSASVNRAWFKVHNSKLCLFTDGAISSGSTNSGLGTLTGGMFFVFDENNFTFIPIYTNGCAIRDEHIPLVIYRFTGGIYVHYGSPVMYFSTTNKFRNNVLTSFLITYIRYLPQQTQSGIWEMVWNGYENIWQLNLTQGIQTGTSTARLTNPVIL